MKKLCSIGNGPSKLISPKIKKIDLQKSCPRVNASKAKKVKTKKHYEFK